MSDVRAGPIIKEDAFCSSSYYQADHQELEVRTGPIIKGDAFCWLMKGSAGGVQGGFCIVINGV